MGIQTTQTGHIKDADGAKLLIKASGDGSFTDMGTVLGTISLGFNFEKEETLTANSDIVRSRVRNMTMTGGFNLININPDNIEKVGGGLFTKVTTAGTTVVDANITDQAIVGYTAGVVQGLNPVITATGATLKFSAAPVLTSVTASVSGVLAANDDYFIIADSNYSSGYGILFNGSGTATVGTSETITVDFGDNDPVASTDIYAGTTSATLTAVEFKIVHTDSDGLERYMYVPSTALDSGLPFNFKGADDGGFEEMAVSFTGKLDSSITDGRQLFQWHTDTGAA